MDGGYTSKHLKGKKKGTRTEEDQEDFSDRNFEKIQARGGSGGHSFGGTRRKGLGD